MCEREREMHEEAESSCGRALSVHPSASQSVSMLDYYINQGILKGEVSLYC